MGTYILGVLKAAYLDRLLLTRAPTTSVPLNADKAESVILLLELDSLAYCLVTTILSSLCSFEVLSSSSSGYPGIPGPRWLYGKHQVEMRRSLRGERVSRVARYNQPILSLCHPTPWGSTGRQPSAYCGRWTSILFHS